MRHARLTPPLPIGPLAPAVILLAYRRGLVSAARCPHLLLSHSPPATVAAIALAAITTRIDGEKRVARWVKASPHAKTFGSLICCHQRPLHRVRQRRRCQRRLQVPREVHGRDDPRCGRDSREGAVSRPRAGGCGCVRTGLRSSRGWQSMAGSPNYGLPVSTSLLK